MTSTLASFAQLITALALAFLPITMKADNATDRTLFDFHTATSSPAWQTVTDDVMGGISSSHFQILPNGGAVFNGAVSLKNNGGFASVIVIKLGIPVSQFTIDSCSDVPPSRFTLVWFHCSLLVMC